MNSNLDLVELCATERPAWATSVRHFDALAIDVLEGKTSNVGWIAGLRNNHYRIPVGLVCDNLAFSSKVWARCKHAIFAESDLRRLTA